MMARESPDPATRPLVLLLSQDLFFSTRLEDGLNALGYRTQVVEAAEQLQGEGDPLERPVPLTEPLAGPDAQFVRALTRLRPALILADLTAKGLPWARWIQLVKTSAATRRIPIVAFGPHVEEQALALAKAAGAEAALPRGTLHRQLETIVSQYARARDEADFGAGCDRRLSERARKGIQLHNAGEYFEAHEELEHAWMAEEGPDGFLYRSLLQVTVAHLHIERDNYRGASKMLLRVRQWLDPLPAACQGVDVDQLRADLDELREALREVGPEQLDGLDRSLLRPIPLAPGALDPDAS